MKTYTKEEKKEYFKGLRERWQSIKDALTAKQLDDIKAVIAEHGLNVSPWSYAFTALSMKSLGYEGIPYLDCKTYPGWKERGFQVKKGEHSKISGITWIGLGNKSEEPDEKEKSETGFLMPKEYHLFHRSQVEEIQ